MCIIKIEREDSSNLLVTCPIVQRNQKIWRHQSAPVLGKYARDEEECPGVDAVLNNVLKFV